MLKKITKYVAVIVCIFLVDFLLKNIYIKNPIYELKTTHYIFNIMDFVRIIIFMGILIYFGIYHNKNMTKASKIVFCILISASLIYIMERSILYLQTNAMGMQIRTGAETLLHHGYGCPQIA